MRWGAFWTKDGVLQGAALRGISDPRQAGVWGSGPRVKILDAGTELAIGEGKPPNY